MAVDAERRLDDPVHLRERVANLTRQAPAVGLAEDDPIGAAFLRRLEAFQRIVGIGAKAVEKMLGVENHFIDALLHERDRIGDDFQVGLLADAQIVAHVQVPGLADQGHHRRIRAEQNFEIDILRRLGAEFSRRAEGCDLGVLELELFHLLEKIGVARIGARIAAFDVVDAHVVELFRDAQLVFERQ